MTAPAPTKVNAKVPRASAMAGLTSMRRSLGDGRVGFRPMKVLLVSPDQPTREAMKVAVSALQRRGVGSVEFLEATDGLEAIRIAWAELPQVVVADEIASHAGAFALARDLRGQERPYPGVIVI